MAEETETTKRKNCKKLGFKWQKKKKNLVFKLTINTILKLGFVAGKGRGACTPATIPAAYPDLQHDVCHSAFILTARKST